MKAVAKFEKVSFNEFCKSLLDNHLAYDEQEAKGYYDKIQLPKRSTSGAAGYDFFCPIPVTIRPKYQVYGGVTFQSKAYVEMPTLIPTGIRCKMEEGYVLKLFPRGSSGIKKGLILANTVGIVDADYYNAKNEGHIHLAFNNFGYEPYFVEVNERIVQGIFEEFFVTYDDEENTKAERIGWCGSTDKVV